MVHRPADSRLLTNLLSHEKDYSKHLSILLEYSQASLASFSAYASASAPPASQVVLAIAGVLVNADDALRKYAASLERWQEQLKALKDLEDEVGNVMRDREILVTRLIKVSKQRSTREGILGASGSNASLPFSKSDSQSLSKLNAAQTELQACEAHLAMKERELDSLRTSAIKVGLQGRCSAMVECGWTWGETGKEGLRALETLAMPNGNGVSQHPYAAAPAYKPLRLPELSSDSGHPASDVSSLAPSQSASQVALALAPAPAPHPNVDTPPRNGAPPKPYTLSIPPAHAIPDIALPNGVASDRISEEGTDEGSSIGEDERQLEVHENARYRKRHDSLISELRHPHFSLRGTQEGEQERHHRLKSPPPRERHKSLFGKTMAALFHRDRDKDKDKDRGDSGSVDGQSPTHTSGSWHTRTDRRLARTKQGDDSSDEERGPLTHHYSTWSPVVSSPPAMTPSTGVAPSRSDGLPTNGTQRLKKVQRNSTQVRSAPRISDADKGYVSDGAAGAAAKAKGAAQSKKPANDGPPKLNGSARTNPATSEIPGSTKAKRPPISVAAHTLQQQQQTSLSRNSSMSKQSAVSAPVQNSPAVVPLQRSSSTSTARKRTTSLDITQMTNAGPVPVQKGHRRTVSASRSGLTRTNEPSLMSIVEGVTRQNRDAWVRQDPNRILFLPKAPAPINFEHIMGAQITATQSAVHVASPDRHAPPTREPVRNPALVSASVSAPTLPTAYNPNRPLPKTPLRSALRSSRSPSPKTAPPAAGRSLDTVSGAATSPKKEKPAPPVDAKEEEDDDHTSVSSYETGHEAFDDDPEPAADDLLSPPAHEVQRLVGGSDLSHTDSTTTTATPPVRRKSVRMSLPPTFSDTPPAIDDDDDNADTPRGRRQPWDSQSRASETQQGGWTSRLQEPEYVDVWQDSSDEDEEYRSAKRLLKRLKKKGAV